MQTSFSLSGPSSTSLLSGLPYMSDPNAQLVTAADLEIMQHGSQAVTHELCSTVLAATAIENTMHLATLAAAAYQIAPWAEDEYRSILRAYTDSANWRIKNF